MTEATEGWTLEFEPKTNPGGEEGYIPVLVKHARIGDHDCIVSVDAELLALQPTSNWRAFLAREWAHTAKADQGAD